MKRHVYGKFKVITEAVEDMDKKHDDGYEVIGVFFDSGMNSINQPAIYVTYRLKD